MSEARKRISHTLAALQNQIEEEKAREKIDPLEGLSATFDFEFIRKMTESKENGGVDQSSIPR